MCIWKTRCSRSKIRFNNWYSFKQKSQINKQNIIVKQQQENNRVILAQFIRKSKKDYLWFGTSYDFNKAKSLILFLSIIFFVVTIVSSALTSVAFNMYSLFSLFENIWSILTCFVLGYSLYSKKRMTDIDMKDHSIYEFVQDADGTWRYTNKQKNVFKIFRIISYISVVANIIIIWINSSGILAVFATIFELAYAGLTIGILIAEINLSCMYGNFILYTGKGADDKQVTIVFDVILKKIITYEEFESKFKQILV